MITEIPHRTTQWQSSHRIHDSLVSRSLDRTQAMVRSENPTGEPKTDHCDACRDRAKNQVHDRKLHGDGIDCVDIFQKLKEDKRVKYLIFKGKIWSAERATEGDRDYDGTNKHIKHLHISINEGMGNDTSPWFWWLNQPKVINQVKAILTPSPSKKTYKTAVCTCCKVHTSNPTS